MCGVAVHGDVIPNLCKRRREIDAPWLVLVHFPPKRNSIHPAYRLSAGDTARVVPGTMDRLPTGLVNVLNVATPAGFGLAVVAFARVLREPARCRRRLFLQPGGAAWLLWCLP